MSNETKEEGEGEDSEEDYYGEFDLEHLWLGTVRIEETSKEEIYLNNLFKIDYSGSAYILDEVVIRLSLPEIKELIELGYEIGSYVSVLEGPNPDEEIIASRLHISKFRPEQETGEKVYKGSS